METVGAIVRRLRGDRSQAWLAAQVSSNQMWVSRIERGEVMPDGDELGLMCDALGASDDDRAAALRALVLETAAASKLTLDVVRAAVGA
jgi:ribosome-binding protein aMBF1 (putative translation factor)